MIEETFHTGAQYILIAIGLMFLARISYRHPWDGPLYHSVPALFTRLILGIALRIISILTFVYSWIILMVRVCVPAFWRNEGGIDGQFYAWTAVALFIWYVGYLFLPLFVRPINITVEAQRHEEMPSGAINAGRLVRPYTNHKGGL